MSTINLQSVRKLERQCSLKKQHVQYFLLKENPVIRVVNEVFGI